MSGHYAMRPGDKSWIIVDVWTGETVVIAGVPQDDLTAEDAGELVALLNLRAQRGAREILQ